MKDNPWITPTWPLPKGAASLITTRQGGCSEGPWQGLNLGSHVGDVADKVAENRNRLAAWLPGHPIWLNQVHGTRVADLDQEDVPAAADAAVTREIGKVLAILTADCLPVLLCSDDARVVGAAHAGWRGLHGGIIEATIAAMRQSPERLLAYLGPAIGPQAFEVGPEVRDAFLATSPQAADCFVAGRGDRWMADLHGLARQRLQAAGVRRIYGAACCTHADPIRFYSYRRDGVTGRMASLIWLER